MEALILAAGYATRLYPLTERHAKPLLPIAGRPLMNHLLDRIVELSEVNRIHVVTNERFYPDFVAWRDAQSAAPPIAVYDDGTTSNEDRRGAIGDVKFALDEGGIDDDLLIVAGDNLFTFDLRPLAEQQRRVGTSIVTYRFPKRELIPRYSTVEVDAAGRVTDFCEKPPAPTTDRIGVCCYLLAQKDLSRVKDYVALGRNQDAPGHFIAWLYQQTPVYAYEAHGLWFDVGDCGSLLEADNAMRRRVGLQERERYELGPSV